MLRKIAVAALVLLLVLGLGPVFAAGRTEAAKKITVGYTPPTLDKADFMGQFEEGLKRGLGEWAQEAGIEYELISRSPADHAAHQVQLQIVEDFITLDVDYIVVIPTSYEGQQGAYRAINNAGIPLVIGNYSDPFPAAWGVQAIQFVGYSHADAGAAMARYLGGRYPRGVAMAIIYGEAGKVSEERGAKQAHIANGFQIVYEDYADWDRVKAYDASERLLTAYPDVKVIVACSSAMAVGAVKAVEAAGLTGKIDVYGAGATIEELDAILAGKLQAAWLRDPIQIGQQAGRAIRAHHEGRANELSLSWNVPIGIVDSYDSLVELVNPITFTGMGREWPPKRP